LHEPGGSASSTEVADALSFALDGCEGTVVAIENHDLLSLRELCQIVARFGSDRVGVTLDTANSLGCLEGTSEVVDALAPFTRCLHIKDVAATRLPTMLGFTVVGTVAGSGGLDIPSILDRMTDRCESVILEQWPPETSAPLALEVEMAKQSFAYLRRALDDQRKTTSGDAQR
jgi:sugar phosphate isomerase/epimerase